MASGLAVIVDEKNYQDPQLRKHIESTTKQAFLDRYGFPCSGLEWIYEGPSSWEDPDTGEVLELGPRRMLIVEGLR